MMSSEMSERYYQKRYGDEFYILDSSIISEKSFDEKLELEGYKAFEDSLAGKEIVNLLNENDELKSKNRGLQSELQIFKEDVTRSNLQINKLADENRQLKYQNELLSDELEQCNAVTNNKSSEYLKKKELLRND